MFVDSVVLLKYFLLENERSWVYFLFLNVPSVAPLLFTFTLALDTKLICRQFPYSGHVVLFLQLYLESLIALLQVIFLI